jgi:hypothetical protein
VTLDPAHESLTREKAACHYCGKRFDLGYHYTCHVCGATYCYIHMSKHSKAHRIPGAKPEVPAEGELVPGVRAQILTSDPEEIELIRTYMMGLLGQGGPTDAALM